MFGSVVLEVFLGIVFIYGVLSLICTTINEAIAGFLSLRANQLKEAIHTMVGAVETIYDSPLLPKFANKPSYISSQEFVATIDRIYKISDKLKREDLQGLVDELPEGPLKAKIRFLWEAGVRDVDQLKCSLESWYNTWMDRLIGAYKRKIQFYGFIVAFLLALGTNADTFTMVERLYQDSSFRTTVVAMASKADTSAPNSGWNTLQQIVKVPDGNPPIGWHDKACPNTLTGVACKLAGILLTAFALSLGAHFWFNLMSQVIRLTGPRPLASPCAPNGNGSAADRRNT